MPRFARLSNAPVSLERDSYLFPYRREMAERTEYARELRMRIAAGKTLYERSDWHLVYGLHRQRGGWRFRAWLPKATAVWLVGDFSGWQKRREYSLSPVGNGDWGGKFPAEVFRHGQNYQLFVQWPGGEGWRLPDCAERVVSQKEPDGSTLFHAQVWDQPAYRWKYPNPQEPTPPVIYEAHVGMAQCEPKVGTFEEFRRNILPRVAACGYNCLQLMAVANHPYYASFGYHVTNFYAVTPLFGTPDDFKRLIDDAHGRGIRVIMDLVHSHSCPNELEGIGNLCGDRSQFFLPGERGVHQAWGSLCFDYAKPQVARFLLSNCRYWLEEYRLDGFRFDGVTSMLYHGHGLNRCFTSYADYFGPGVDWASCAYLSLANELVHVCRPQALTFAEDVSGMPGLAAPLEQGGLGFDYRLAMGVTDYWFKLLDIPDEHWSMSGLWHETTNRRQDERTVSYVECHDQSLVGGRTFLFRCLGEEMYTGMDNPPTSPTVIRGLALHKMSRLLTAVTAGHGYLTFMGNEFGHPEWVDFPREGNGWSFDHARRRWDLCDDPRLCFHGLWLFERRLLHLLANHDLYASRPQLLRLDEDRKILACERNGLIFVFNFHPENSYADFQLEVPGGYFQLVLDSDSRDFCGLGRQTPAQRQVTCRIQAGDIVKNCLRLYLPSRTAAVWQKLG